MSAATIEVRPLTTANLARVLEQQAGAILLAVIEASGHDPREGWSLVLDGAHLERTGPPQDPAPVTPSEGGRDGVVERPASVPSPSGGAAPTPSTTP